MSRAGTSQGNSCERPLPDLRLHPEKTKRESFLRQSVSHERNLGPEHYEPGVQQIALPAPADPNAPGARFLLSCARVRNGRAQALPRGAAETKTHEPSPSAEAQRGTRVRSGKEVPPSRCTPFHQLGTCSARKPAGDSDACSEEVERASLRESSSQ